MLVYRPVDPDRFNGTVVLHWNNVSAGYELFSGDTPELLEGGYAFAGVTTQRVGVHGLPAAPQGLQAWDPERYGSLSIASDDDSFDIFTQAARAVGPDRDRTTDPLGGLDVAAGDRDGQLAVGGPPRRLRQRHPPARPGHRRLPAADLLRQRLRRSRSATRSSTSSTRRCRSTPAPHCVVAT